MITSIGSAPAPDLTAARQQVDAILADFLDRKQTAARAQHLPDDVVRTLSAFLAAGGKRLRPLLCVTGWHAAAGQQPPTDAVLRAAAALEMFHAFCLIHDDVMDRSAVRRGQPTVHCALADHYSRTLPRLPAERSGNSAAILIGDVALAWSDELLHTAAIASGQLATVLPLFHVMRTEVMYGQYLDVTATGVLSTDLDHALAIARYKTAKYTIERPLHIGAALAGAGHGSLDVLSAFALPLGEAFQLRDDLLGVFGDPQTTGKSHLDDLREGKHTVLAALALRDASPAHSAILRRLVGDPRLTEAEAAQVRTILTVTGARAHVEHMIDERREQALRQLTSPPGIRPEAHDILRRLAETATRRSS